MARNPKQAATAGAGSGVGKAKAPVTSHTGVNASCTKTVLISALLEVTGQIRFGDGTDIATTVTEKDKVIAPNGQSIEKAVWAGTKRRGVDRRTMHEFRDRLGWEGECFIPQLCTECPVCWLLGFTGTTQKKEINAKSRALYATSLSIENTVRCLNRHSRNQVDEKSQTTAGVAGIHEEEVIVAGTHFPIHTSLVHVLDWEIGVVAHAFLENVNANRYTAASRGQGGIKFVDRDGEPAIVVDESPWGVFPLAVPKVASWETDAARAIALFAPERQSAVSIAPLQDLLKRQGFAVEASNGRLTARSGEVELTIESNEKYLLVHQGADELMRRYYGNQALGYLRQKQVEAQKALADEQWRRGFAGEAQGYAKAISPKSRVSGTETAAAAPDGDQDPIDG